MKFLPFAAGLAALVLSACVAVPPIETRVSVLPLGRSSYPAYGNDHAIAVFETFNDVDREYVKIGRIQAQQVNNAYGTPIPQMSQVGEVIESMMSRAREVGADALVLREGMEVNMSGESQGSSTVSRVNTTGMSLNDLYGHTAIAIRFVGAE